MKPTIALALVCATAMPAAALAQQTGTAHPPEAIVEDAPQPIAKPSAAVPMTPAATAAPAAVTPAAAPQPVEEFKAYQPLNGPAVTLHTHTDAKVDPDAGIVTEIPHQRGELPAGTSLRVRLQSELATNATQSNEPFTARLDQDIESEGRVVLPAGSTVEGTVTQVRGGRRIHGAALIHLQAQSVVLPDGTRMPLKATVIDTDQYAETRIDSEGNIVRKDHAGATLAALSLTTGSAAVAGAVLGGGVGALVGAGVGAGIGTAWWLKQDRQTHLPKDTLVVFSLTESMRLQPAMREPDFSAIPAPTVTPEKTTMTSTAAPEPAPPAAIAPQSFVPTN